MESHLTDTKKKRIIVLGIGQANYILQLYNRIIPKYPGFVFSISDLRILFNSKEEETARSLFAESLNLETAKWSIGQRLKAFFVVFTKKWVYKELLILILTKSLGFRSIKNTILVDNIRPYLLATYLKKHKYDYVHVHFIRARYISFLKYLPTEIKCICTFWGSDLMRTAGMKEYYFQSLSLSRAKLITCATWDMANIVLSKYGRKLESKIRVARLIHDPSIYEMIDSFRNRFDWQADFRNKYSIPSDHFIVVIGHNAAPENNHIPILKALELIPDSSKKKITCVIPLTYSAGTTVEYISTLKRTLSDYSIDYLLLEKYLSWEELAKWKLISDIMIHMPKSDALSAALTEYMYAGGIAITGSWLPYISFLKIGLKYHTLDSFDEIQKIIETEISENKAVNVFEEHNIRTIKDAFSLETIEAEWLKVFNEI